MNTIVCHNCHTEFEGNYCPGCSQSARANARLTIKNIFTDLVNTVFNLDRGFFYTFMGLMKNPGKVVRSFINGKRKQYTSPVKYLIIATAIQALFEYLFMHKEQGIPFTEYSFLSPEMNQNMYAWNEILTLQYPLIYGFVLLLFWPIPFYFLFRKLKYNYTELIALMMYLYGTIVILIQVMAVVHNPLTGKNVAIELVSLLALTYMTYACLSFYQKGIISLRVPRLIAALFLVSLIRLLIVPLLLSVVFPLQ